MKKALTRSILILALITALMTSTVLVGGGNLTVNAADLSETTTIWSPRGHSPTIVQPGGTITVEVLSSITLQTSGWNAKLQIEIEETSSRKFTKSWNAQVTSVTTGKVDNGTKDGYIFTVKVPDDISPELMDVELSHSSHGSIVSLRCVSIVPDFDGSFYVLHNSDEHVVTSGSTTEIGFYGRADIIMKKRSTPIINIINPRFLISTGDSLHIADSGNLKSPTECESIFRVYSEALLDYTVPTIYVNGNHDPIKSHAVALYEKYFGQLATEIKMGKFYFLGYDWNNVNGNVDSWARNKWQSSFNDSNITYRLLAGHYFSGSSPADASKPADLMLAGHLHVPAYTHVDPFPVLNTRTALNLASIGFFNFRKEGDTWVCEQNEGLTDNRVENIDVFQLFKVGGADPKVTLTFEKANDGTQTSNTATVKNLVKQNFYDGRAKFLMKRGRYTSEDGEILAQYDYGTNSTAVVVRVDIQPAPDTSGTNPTFTSVTVKPAEPVDKSALQAAIDNADELDSEEYNDRSWNDMQEVLAKTKKVNDYAYATQDHVDAALAELNSAVNGLVLKDGVDKVPLQELVEVAENLTEADYTSRSWGNMQDKLDAAKDVLSDPNANRDDVDGAQKSLEESIRDLVSLVELKAAISEAQSQIANQSQYTASSWKYLLLALDNANALLADRSAPRYKVKNAVEAINNNINMLVFKASAKPNNKMLESFDGIGTNPASITSFRYKKGSSIVTSGNDFPAIVDSPDYGGKALFVKNASYQPENAVMFKIGNTTGYNAIAVWVDLSNIVADWSQNRNHKVSIELSYGNVAENAIHGQNRHELVAGTGKSFDLIYTADAGFWNSDITQVKAGTVVNTTNNPGSLHKYATDKQKQSYNNRNYIGFGEDDQYLNGWSPDVRGVKFQGWIVFPLSNYTPSVSASNDFYITLGFASNENRGLGIDYGVKWDSVQLLKNVGTKPLHLLQKSDSDIDRVALGNIIGLVNEAISNDEFSQSELNEIETNLEQAEAVFDNPSATQAEIDEKTEALFVYYVKRNSEKVDKSKLEQEIAAAYNILSDDNKKKMYTEESINNLQEKYDDAIAVYANPLASQDDVDTAEQNLKDAREALELKDGNKLRGDANTDGVVNSLDALQILKHVSERITMTGPQQELGDVNDDDKITTQDALKILAYLSDRISEL